MLGRPLYLSLLVTPTSKVTRLKSHQKVNAISRQLEPEGARRWNWDLSLETNTQVWKGDANRLETVNQGVWRSARRVRFLPGVCTPSVTMQQGCEMKSDLLRH